MSVKNKTKDRDSNGRIRREYTSKAHWRNYSSVPRWFCKLYYYSPCRTRAKEYSIQILKGEDPELFIDWEPKRRRAVQWEWS